MTYLGPKVIGNFRERGPKKPKKATWRDERPGMSEAHLAMLRNMPCVVCHKAPAGTVHHLKAGTGERGMGVKSTDRWTLPMCFDDHETVERVGTRNENNHFRGLGIDSFTLAIALWGARGDEALIRKLILEHRQPRPKT